MRAENFDFISNLDTLWAVGLGAVLATVGGFVATQVEHRVDAGRRQKQAALFFGEVMALLGTTVSAAERARGVGDPYGPVTMRLLRTIRREIDVYDRNRERLFELRDPSLRIRIHTTLLRTIMGVQGAIEAAEECTALAAELKMNPDMSEARREHLTARLADQCNRRDGGFDFLIEASRQAAAVIKELEPIAKVDFAALVQAARNG